MKNTLKYLGALATIIAGVSATHYIFASTLSAYPPVFETYLTSQQGTADTALSLANVTLRDGSTLSGYVCLTIDGNSPSLEYECGTLTGKSVAVSARGLDAVSGTTTIASLKQTHRRGADVKITDYPIITQIQRMLSGIDVIPAVVRYVTGTTQSSSDVYALADIGYVNGVAIAGAPNSSEAVNGISQISTQTQAASSTSTGSTGARLVLPGSMATDTPNTATRSGRVLMSDMTGYLKQAWNNLSALWTFTGGLTSTATTTLTASNVLSNALVINTVPYAFPSTLGASSTVLSTDASGNLTWEPVTVTRYTFATTSAIVADDGAGTAYATSTLLSIPANTFTASSTITVVGGAMGHVVAGSGACTISLVLGTGVSLLDQNISLNDTFRQVTFTVVGNNSASSQINTGTIEAFNTTPSAQNLSSAFSIGVRVKETYLGGSNHGQCTLYGFSIIVSR